MGKLSPSSKDLARIPPTKEKIKFQKNKTLKIKPF